MEANNQLYFLASDLSISQEKSNDIFLIIEMRMLSTRANKNKEGVTEAFIDEIIANQETYECLPLYADVQRLKAKDYRNLGHMQNRFTGTFGTTQVGGMLNFRKVEDEFGVSLIGEARIPKREHVICQRVIELYSMGELNFSFEIKYTDKDTVKKDGVLFIDAGESNTITGMAIVSVPAYDESFALSLVAEERNGMDKPSEEAEKGVETMDKTEMELDQEQAVAESECKKPEDNACSEVTEAKKKCEAEESDAAKKCEAEETEGAKKCKAEEAEAAKKCKSECDPDDDMDDMDDEEDCMNGECGKKAKSECKKQTESECGKKKVAELEASLAESKEEALAWQAKWAAINAEKEKLCAQIADLSAQIEALRAVEAEMEAIRAQKAAEELAAKQEMARAYAQKQGLDIEQEAVASAVESLDYTKIAEMVMERDAADKSGQISYASYSAFEPMKITNRFEHVLKRVTE